VSAGVFTGVATAIVDLAPPTGRALAGLLAAIVNMLRLGLGPLLSGALADLAPYPLVLPYVVHIALVAVGAAGLAVVPEPVTRRPGPVRWQVQRIGVNFVELLQRVAPHVRALVAGAALVLPVSPLFLGQVLHETRHIVPGLVVFAVLGSSTAGQLLSVRLASGPHCSAGVSRSPSVLVVAVGIAMALLPVLVAGAVIAGFGQGASFRAGLQAVTSAAPADRRSEVSSSYFLVLYVAISIPVIGVGAGAQVFGLVPTAVVFAGIVALLAVGAFVSLLSRPA
jgi:hypothetical protein